jgi:hypothetical protein
MSKNTLTEAQRKRKNASRRASSARKRAAVAAIKAATPCADCGKRSHPDAVDFDHLPGYTKTAKVSKLVSEDRSMKVILAEIAACHVVCRPCHVNRTRTRRLNGVRSAGEKDFGTAPAKPETPAVDLHTMLVAAAQHIADQATATSEAADVLLNLVEEMAR